MRITPSLLLLSLALLSCLSVHAETVKDERPNILWLTSEDNSAEWLGCYGNPLAKTPNIDKLATEGFRYTHVAICRTSHGASTPATLGE
jgi:arylsulfatase A-like enzyme